jgi:hypothetical protein
MTNKMGGLRRGTVNAALPDDEEEDLRCDMMILIPPLQNHGVKV